ncbi:hypothetical protein [Candidatus Laterigemmans baculatus]|uniref:hypothetical protein n=1 Tax=Candidatus Laterigemmans baculatus TaxID=2770505 RepID=UPI0013DD11C4|nr:hypothetical protein [Candidatus Laterigemmans baculatus]
MPTPAVEPTLRSRLLPQLSFRSAMLAVTGTVFLAWLARLAWQGQTLAQVICFTLLSLAGFYLISIALFFAAWIPAILMRRYHDSTPAGNPFAAEQLPPQILPPKGTPQ